VKIKILGPGCPNCEKVEKMVKNALKELNVEAEIEKITDFKDILQLVPQTPGIIINDKIKHSGKPLPRQEQVKDWIKEEASK
jgi:small redox-active disulfide protein 2